MHRTAVQLALGLFLSGLVGVASGAPQRRGLTLTQIEKLLEIHTPDDVVAQEVRARGLDFTPTPKILEELQRRGAGKGTLGVLRQQMPIGTLEVQAAPGSQVAIDGAARGVTNAQGRLVLSDLAAGAHQIVVSRTGYHAGDFRLTLSAREYKRFPVQLDWAGGYLTVRSDPPSATIKIAGLGQFDGNPPELQCDPGTYDITVTHAGMKSESRSVVVAAGQHAAFEIRLTPDPEWLRSRIAAAEAQLASGNTAPAVQIANELLAVDANNTAARTLVYHCYLTDGVAALKSSQWDQSLAYFQKASTLEPTKPDAWAEMGRAYLAAARYNEATHMWDKALALGGGLSFDVWHYKVTRFDRATFRLSAKSVSFFVSDQERVFSAAPTEVSSVKSHHPLSVLSQVNAWSFGMKVGGRNYWFSFVPLGVDCETPLTCSDAAGYDQEGAVANYVARTIGKLASGSFAKQ